MPYRLKSLKLERPNHRQELRSPQLPRMPKGEEAAAEKSGNKGTGLKRADEKQKKSTGKSKDVRTASVTVCIQSNNHATLLSYVYGNQPLTCNQRESLSQPHIIISGGSA